MLPAARVWTEFEVKDVDGTVRIAARKGDLTISDDRGTTTLAEGQETTREESQGNKKGKNGAGTGSVPGASGGILNSPVAIGIGGGIIVGVAAFAVIRGDDPASPTH